MTDTARTLAYLIGTLFPDGRPAGAINPQALRDFVTTMSVRGKPVIYAGDPEYGVVADGTTDDTAAWGTVWSAAPTGAIVYAPVGVSIVGSSGITVPAGVTLEATNYRPYGGGTTNGSVIKSTVTTGTSPVVALAGNSTLKSITVVGPGTDGFGNGTSRACVKWGGPSVSMDNVSCTNGALGVDGNYQSVGSMRFCQMQQCATGATNLVDSHFVANQFSACGTGVYLSSGSNHNHWTANRFEFCAQHNLSAAGAGAGVYTGENTFTGNTFDRAGYNSVNLSWCHHFTFTGNLFERSSANATANTANDAHVTLANCSVCSFTGNVSLAAQSDSQTGPFSPSWGVWDNGSNTNCLIKNNIWVYHSVNGTNGGGINVTTTFTTFSSDNLSVAATAPYVP